MSAALFNIGAGLLGLGGAGFVAAPPPGDAVVGSLSGPVFGGGVFVEARILEIVGLEADALYTRESVGGGVRFAGSEGTVTLAQPSLRFPILAKGVLPLGTLAPFVALGPEFSVQGLSDVGSAPEGRLRGVASSASTVWLTAALGIEWRPGVGKTELRIPIALRLSTNPGGIEGDRVTALPSGALVWDSTLQHRAALTAGAGIAF